MTDSKKLDATTGMLTYDDVRAVSPALDALHEDDIARWTVEASGAFAARP